MDIELNHLRHFYWVSECRSFTETAKKYRTSQPSLSKSVRMLEERIGFSLFERSKQGVALTEIGKIVASECREIFSRVRAIENHCQTYTKTYSGPLRFAASDHIAYYLLSETVAQVGQKFPEIIPKVFVGSPLGIVDQLENRQSEFGLCFTRVPSEVVRYKALTKLPVSVVCHPNLADQKNIPQIASIVEHYDHSPHLDFVDKKMATAAKTQANSQELQKRLCLQGAGAAILMTFMVSEEIKEGKLVQIKQKSPKQATLFKAQRKDHTLSPAANFFLEKFIKNYV